VEVGVTGYADASRHTYKSERVVHLSLPPPSYRQPTKANMVSCHQLPAEVWTEVIEYLDLDDRKTVLSTCHYLYHCGRGLVWTRIELCAVDVHDLLRKISLCVEQLEESPCLQQYVRFVRLYRLELGEFPSDDSFWLIGDQFSENEEHTNALYESVGFDEKFARLLQLTPNATSVALNMPWEVRLGFPHTLRAICAFSELRRLALSNFVTGSMGESYPQLTSRALEELVAVNCAAVPFTTFLGKQPTLKRVELQMNAKTSIGLATSWSSIQALSIDVDDCRFDKWILTTEHALVSKRIESSVTLLVNTPTTRDMDSFEI
jgi:hypothetical protein